MGWSDFLEAIKGIKDSLIRLNATTASYFRLLARISAPDAAARYQSILDA